MRDRKEVVLQAGLAVRALLELIGEDPDREGLERTPERVVNAWLNTWAAGYDMNPDKELRVDFKDGGEGYDELVLVKDIPIYSHCEHHMTPFFGKAFIGYIPDGKKITGLSKFARVADIYARRLQVQERLTMQIADCVWRVLSPKGVAVVLECRHLCMESRGVQKAGVSTTTSAMHGVFKDKPEARAEFMGLIR